jgi:NADH-ubiquinone oxidoreductase chain 2
VAQQVLCSIQSIIPGDQPQNSLFKIKTSKMLLINILFFLISSAVTIERERSFFFNRIGIILLINIILIIITNITILNTGIGIHGGLLYITNITQIFHIFIFFLSILILQLTSFYSNKGWNTKVNSLYSIFPISSSSYELNTKINKIINKLNNNIMIIEYPLIILFIITGAIFLISTSDLLSIFLSIELQSYGLYLLSTINRNSELSVIGGLTYFLLGALSSCFILLGISLLYINSGTSNLENIYIINNIEYISEINNSNLWYKSNYINYSLLILSIGFLFKISAAPFHIWSPDVYDLVPTIITTFLISIPKISIFIFLLELVYFTNNKFIEFDWTYSLLLSSLFSLLIGTIVGLTQFRVKRLLTYSTISHVGFMLLALSISSIESIEAFLFYLMQYSISNLNVFIILVSIGFFFNFCVTNNKEYEKLIDKENSPLQLIDQLKGFFYINPFISLSLIISIFSFIGVPPLIGFFAKQMVLSAALDKGYIFMSFIAIFTSVIGAVYYLNLVKNIFFFLPDYKKVNILHIAFLKKGTFIFYDDSIKKYPKYFWNEFKYINIFLSSFNLNSIKDWFLKINIENYYIITISSSISFTISILTLIILLFIFINSEWLSMCTILVQNFFYY